MVKRRSRVAKIAMITIVVAIGIGGIVLDALYHAFSGRGAETYRNVYGLPIHYTSVLILIGITILALAVASFMRWWDRRAVRRLQDEIDRQLASRSQHP